MGRVVDLPGRRRTGSRRNQCLGQVPGVYDREFLRSVAEDRGEPRSGRLEELQDIPVPLPIDYRRPHDGPGEGGGPHQNLAVARQSMVAYDWLKSLEKKYGLEWVATEEEFASNQQEME